MENLIVNFGGPRSLGELQEFMVCLFRDQELIRTRLPALLHNLLFTRLAKKRAREVARDYASIGNRSPLYEDTEAIARHVSNLLGSPVRTFHRYLPQTHPEFIEKMHRIDPKTPIRVFSLFPQFSSATTGSIAHWFVRHLDRRIIQQMYWVKSYPLDKGYLHAFEQNIRLFLNANHLEEGKTILLFSAHGVPQSFIASGDVYEQECEQTFYALASRFPQALSQLCYQSQFGKDPWIEPYTRNVCQTIDQWGKGYRNVVVVPLSFTTDHVETLFEVQQQYLPLLKERGFHALRCPALNQDPSWMRAIAAMMQGQAAAPTSSLLRT